MKFSIVTPSYNQGRFISQTIESVIRQKGDFEIEYRVIDGGSNDHTIDILKQYACELQNDPRIRFHWTSEKDRGQAHAINKGFAEASGDVFAFINSDDYYEPDVFDIVSRQFADNPDRIWLTGYNRIINGNSQAIQHPVTRYKNFWLNTYSRNTLLVLNFVSQPSTFFRKEAFKNWGPFDESLHLCMDYHFWLCLSAVSRPMILRSFLSNFRIHSASKGKKSFGAQFDEELAIASKYTTDPLLILLHRIHNQFIKAVYRLIK